MREFLQIVMPSQKQWWLYCLAPALIGGVLLLPQEAFQFYFVHIFRYLQQDKAVSIMGITTLWFLTSTYLLRYEKDAEIKELKSKIESLESTLKIMAKTLGQKNKEIEDLKQELNFKQVLSKGQESLNELAEVRIKLPFK